MFKMVEEAIPAIRLFFTGLLAMSRGADEPQVNVGIYHRVAKHYMRITAIERPIELYGWGESYALYTGLPIQLYTNSISDPPFGHWKLEVSDTANPLYTDNILQSAVVLDGGAFHNRPLTSSLNEEAFQWKFSFNKGQVYGGTKHLKLLKKSPSGGDTGTPFQAAINFGVNIHLGSKTDASIIDGQNKTIFRFHPQCRYDVYVSCLPDYAPPDPPARASVLEPTDFQLHYDAFRLPRDEWYDVEPNLPAQADDGATGDVGVNFVNPCVPIFLSQTQI